MTEQVQEQTQQKKNLPPIPKRPKRRRTAAEIARDNVRISDLYLKGTSQVEIGIKLKLSQATISRAIEKMINEWREISFRKIDEQKAIELAKINRLEMTYWEAWERSLEDVETKSTKVTGTDLDQENSTPAKGERSVTEKQSLGDPRYLQGVERCIKMRTELLGTNAPKKFAPTDPDGNALDSQVIFYIPVNGREAQTPNQPDEDEEPESDDE